MLKKKKKSEKVCSFSDNCICIGCVKLSLLSRKCLSLAVNVLTNRLTSFYITKRDFFQCHYLHSD